MHRGHHIETGSTVALKVLLPAFAEDEETRARFVREAESLRRLTHPNVVGYIGSGIEETVFYIALELVEGRSLEDQITAHPKGLGWPVVAKLLATLTEALDAAHQLEIIHRDLKPGNVMLASSGAIKVVDFGLASAADELVATQDGTRMGSFLYSAPEQNEGKKVDGRADLYSLGIVAYEALTGVRPFAPGSPFQVLLAQLNEQYVKPSEQVAGVPDGVDELLAGLLRGDREERIPSAAAFRLRLQEFSNDGPDLS